jgi:hypothetical protein
MTQALNLANFANNLNTSGATTNAGLQNSSVTVTAGTGMSGGGAVALGSSVTLTNAGVTSVTGAGTVSVSASTGAVTITGTGGSGTVTSVATGNGLSGGTITSSGTLDIACPTYNTVGSYSICAKRSEGGNNASNVTSGSNYAAGSGNNQVRAIGFINASPFTTGSNILSGSWKAMTATGQGAVGACCGVAYFQGLFCRVS